MFLSHFNQLIAQESSGNSEYGTLILDYLKDVDSRYNFQDEDIEELVVNNHYYSENTGITHVYVNQTYQGIRIANAISSIAIKNDAVFYYANRL